MSFTFVLFDFPIFTCWYYVNANVQKTHFKENFKLWQTNLLKAKLSHVFVFLMFIWKIHLESIVKNKTTF